MQVWHQYAIRCDYRDSLKEYLAKNGVENDILYPTPPNLQPCYSEFSSYNLPIRKSICDTILSIPISSLTSQEDAKEIRELINRFQA